MKMIRSVYFLCGLLFAWINGVKNQAMCYNNQYDEVKHCDYGCCGTELEVECCLSSRLIPFAAAGAAFFVIMAVAVVVICYRKQRALKRILDTGSRVPITNDRTINLHQTTMVNNIPHQWRHCSHTTDPPPYIGAPPPYIGAPPPYIGAPPPYIGAPPPYTEDSSENLQQTFRISQQPIQPAPPAYTTSDVHHGYINSNPQTSLSYNEPPPRYGVYADLAHSREQRM